MVLVTEVKLYTMQMGHARSVVFDTLRQPLHLITSVQYTLLFFLSAHTVHIACVAILPGLPRPEKGAQLQYRTTGPSHLGYILIDQDDGNLK